MAGFWRIEQPERLERGNWLRKQSGFTLIETIVAMLLVATMIVGLVPLYSYIHSHEINNMTRVVTYNLAESQIEQIKSTSFDLMGTKGGSPSGSTPQTQGPLPLSSNKSINCMIYTQIQWEADPSRPQNSVNQTDYKEISVEVKAFLGPQLLTNGSNVLQDVIVTSMASQEGAEDPPGNNIIVYAQRGWNTNPDPSEQNAIPATDLPVTITSSGSSINMQTDPATGEIIFGQLNPATYSVSLTNSWNSNGTPYTGMMEFPGDSNKTNQPFTLTSTATTYILNPYIHVEAPCKLSVTLDNLQLSNGVIVNNTPVPSSFSGSAALSYPETFNLPVATYSLAGSSLTIPNLWPVGAGWTWYDTSTYGLTVDASSYYPYDILVSGDWNGEFDSPGENKQVTLNLAPLPQVYVANLSQQPITNATVTAYVYQLTYASQSGTWGSPVLQGTLFTASNSSNGYYTFNNLETSKYNSVSVTTLSALPSSSPANGDTCTAYYIQVSAPTYTPYNPDPNTTAPAFWIYGMYNNASGLEMQWNNGPSETSLPSLNIQLSS